MNFLEFISSGIGLSLLSAMLGTLLPSPMDFIHFMIQDYLYNHRVKKLSFELIQIADWYLLDSIWYLILFGLAFFLSIENQSTFVIITVIATTISIGATIGIFGKFFMSKKHR